MLKARNGISGIRADIYSTEAIIDPYPHYARLRMHGPVVWLPRQARLRAATFTECKATLRDDKTFVSEKGVALNRLTNRLSRGTTLRRQRRHRHDQRRKLVAHRLLPRALRGIDDSVQEQAARVVDIALARGHVDGVEDLACALPLAVVPDLIGWPRDQRRRFPPPGLGWCDFRHSRPDESPRHQGSAVQPAHAALHFVAWSGTAVSSRAVWATRSFWPPTRASCRRRVRPADDRLHRPVTGHHDERHLECAAPVRRTSRPVAAPASERSVAGFRTRSTRSSGYDLHCGHSPPGLARRHRHRWGAPVRAGSPRARASTPQRTGMNANGIHRKPFDIRRDATRQLGFGHGAHALRRARFGPTRNPGHAAGRLLKRVDRIELAAPPTRGRSTTSSADTSGYR